MTTLDDCGDRWCYAGGGGDGCCTGTSSTCIYTGDDTIPMHDALPVAGFSDVAGFDVAGVSDVSGVDVSDVSGVSGVSDVSGVDVSGVSDVSGVDVSDVSGVSGVSDVSGVDVSGVSDVSGDLKSPRLNSSHSGAYRMPSSA